MSSLTIERTFPVDRAKVYAFVTQTDYLSQWWGPEEMTLTEYELDFTKPGPWSCTKVNAEGKQHKVSGQVVAVDPPNSIEFTWGWHDDQDERGNESIVRFELNVVDTGATHFQITHTELPNDISATNHNRGWVSSLRKLERLVENS